MENRLGQAGRHVDPVFQHGWRHYVGFVQDLVKAGCLGWVHDAVEHVGLLLFPRRLGLRDSLLMLVQATDKKKLHLVRCSQVKGLAMSISGSG